MKVTTSVYYDTLEFFTIMTTKDIVLRLNKMVLRMTNTRPIPNAMSSLLEQYSHQINLSILAPQSISSSSSSSSSVLQPHFIPRVNPSSSSYTNKNEIYCNNYLNFNGINVVGFDLDYTLVSYTEELQTLIYNLARGKLINMFGFPKDLQSIQYDANFAVRGLSVDVNKGLVCKLSYTKRIGLNYVYRGKKRLSDSEIDLIYGDNRHVTKAE